MDRISNENTLFITIGFDWRNWKNCHEYASEQLQVILGQSIQTLALIAFTRNILNFLLQRFKLGYDWCVCNSLRLKDGNLTIKQCKMILRFTKLLNICFLVYLDFIHFNLNPLYSRNIAWCRFSFIMISS